KSLQRRFRLGYRPVQPRSRLETSILIVMRRKWMVSLLLVASAPALDNYTAASEKFRLIESDRLRPGSRVTLTYPELDAWVAHEAPNGVRNPHLQAMPNGSVQGSAMVDFAKVRTAQGQEPGWLLRRLLEGERPVSVTARVRSSAGTATVDVERVE